MSDDQLSNEQRATSRLLSEHASLVIRHGIGSPEVEAFLELHKDNQEFVACARLSSLLKGVFDLRKAVRGGGFFVQIDERMKGTLDVLQQYFQQPDEAAVLRKAIALLNVAKDAHERGQRVAVLNKDGTVWKDIAL